MYSKIFFLALYVVASTKEVKFHNCPGVVDGICQIHSVEISPCGKSFEGCTVRIGDNIRLKFSYTTKFSSLRMLIRVHAKVFEDNVELTNFLPSQDFCLLSHCPMIENRRNFFEIAGKMPRVMYFGNFPVTVMIYNEFDKYRQCCFQIYIEVAK